MNFLDFYKERLQKNVGERYERRKKQDKLTKIFLIVISVISLIFLILYKPLISLIPSSLLWGMFWDLVRENRMQYDEHSETMFNQILQAERNDEILVTIDYF